MDETTAVKVLASLLRFSDPIGDLTEISEAIPATDGQEMRRHLGVIMIELHKL